MHSTLTRDTANLNTAVSSELAHHIILTCLQAVLQSLTLPAYAPDIQAGGAYSFRRLHMSMKQLRQTTGL